MADQTNQKRDFPRYDTDVLATLTSRPMTIAVRMLSVSASGALVRMDRLSAKVFDEEAFLIEITGIGRFSASRKWRRDTDIGAKFDLTESDRIKLAARLADRFGRHRSHVSLAASSPQP